MPRVKEIAILVLAMLGIALFFECSERAECIPEDEWDFCDEERESRQF